MRTKVSTKGQVVIPKEARDALGWADGTVLDVVVDGASIRLVREAPFGPPLAIDEVAGIGRRWYTGGTIAEAAWSGRVDDALRAKWAAPPTAAKRARRRR